MRIEELRRMDEWAARRIGSGNETPWDWYQLMKLREALEALISSEENRPRLQTDASPARDRRPESHVRLVADRSPPDSAPPRPEAGE